LELILSQLTLKEKLKLETVSKQFQNCVQNLLEKQNQLLIGGKSFQNFDNNFIDKFCDQKTHKTFREKFIISQNDFNYNYLLSNCSQKSLEKVFKYCLNLKSILFNYLIIDFKTIEWVCSQCKRLECLVFINNKFNIDFDEWILITNRLSQSLIHLYFNETNFTLNYKSVKYLIENSTKLQSITIFENSFNEINPKFDLKFGQNLKTLRLNQRLTLSEVKTICEQNIISLESVDLSIADSIGDEVFSLITKNMRQLRQLTIALDTLCSGVKHISKLNNLQELSLEFRTKTFVNFSLINLSFGLRSLKSLDIIDGAFTPKMINKIENLFPNLTKFRLKYCLFCCDCFGYSLDNFECNECQEKCFKSLSKLSKIKFLHLSFGLKFPINSLLINDLKLFKNLNTLELSSIYLNQNNLQKLLISSLESIANMNRKKLIKVRITGNLSEKSLAMNLPKNLKILKYN
jgi:hypothetical protein